MQSFGLSFAVALVALMYSDLPNTITALPLTYFAFPVRPVKQVLVPVCYQQPSDTQTHSHTHTHHMTFLYHKPQVEDEHRRDQTNVGCVGQDFKHVLAQMTGSKKLSSAEMKGKTATVLEASPVFSLYDLHTAQLAGCVCKQRHTCCAVCWKRTCSLVACFSNLFLFNKWLSQFSVLVNATWSFRLAKVTRTLASV